LLSPKTVDRFSSWAPHLASRALALSTTDVRTTVEAGHPLASPTRPLALATISFTLCFAAWGLIGGLSSVFTSLYRLNASQTALLVAVPVLLGSVARLPIGMATDRFGGRLVFTALLMFSSVAAFLVPLANSYQLLLGAAFLIGMAGSSFAVGAAFVSRWTPAARQGTALGIYGLGTMGQSLAVFVGPVVAARLGWEAVFRGMSALLLVWAIVYLALARNPAQSGRPASIAAMTAVLRRAPTRRSGRTPCSSRITGRERRA
jgi:MFS transporter, NNP family, nitrate/nitrite transporter